MTITLKLSKLICQVLVGVMLFAQLAIAAYACPNPSGMNSMPMDGTLSAAAAAPTVSDAPNPGATPEDAVPGCHQIDPGAANLCAEHCRFGHQSVDTAPVPVVFAPAPALLYALPLEPGFHLGSLRSAPASDPALAVAPPPHAILHCVFRI